MASRFDDEPTKRVAGGATFRPGGPRPEIDDATLQRCVEHDSKAEKAFVKTYEQRIRAWVKLAHGTKEDSDDLAQEVFLRAFQGIAGFVPPSRGGDGQVSTWLFRIARNVLIDQYRQRKKRVTTVPFHDVEQIDVEQIPSSASPQQERERTERREAIERAMEALSDDQRSALLLFQIEGKTYKEIAGIHGVNENTVKKRLYNARMKLRGQLKGQAHEEESQDDD